MKDINVEGFDDRLHYLPIENLSEVMIIIDCMRIPKGNQNQFSYLIKLNYEKLDYKGEIHRLFAVSQLILPPIKKGGIIASDQELKENSNEELVIIKDSRDLDNLETRLSNPSWGSTIQNQTFLKFKNYEAEKTEDNDKGQPESQLPSENNTIDKASMYLSKYPWMT